MVLNSEIYRSCIESINYSQLPPIYRQTVRNYVERGINPGEAIQLALEGSVKSIIVFNDPIALRSLAQWLYNELPPFAWGTQQRVRAWISLAKRMSGSSVGV